MGKPEVPGVGAYGGPAGGRGALQAVARTLRAQMALNRETGALRRVNQPQGFDCPGCAWPDPRHASSFEFCENGAKAVAWEATRKRADLDFFAAHPVSELWNWTLSTLRDVKARRHHRRVQSAQRTRPRTLPVAAAHPVEMLTGRATKIASSLSPGARRRRRGGDEGADEGAAGARR